MTYICRYLQKDSIIQLSKCNETLNDALNPENNSIINLKFLIALNKQFFEFDEEEKSNLSKNINLLSKLLNTKTNWKSVLGELYKSFKNYDNKDIIQKVLNCFKIHLYLPDLRKEDFHLEYSSSTMHQIFCYDSLFKTECKYNYYGKFITKEYIMQDLEKENEKNEEIKEIRILRENLFFENELKDFKVNFNKFINDIEYQIIIKNAVKYNYEFLDSIYENHNYYNNCNNNIIKVLLYITHLFIVNSDYIYKYISSFNRETDEKTILLQYAYKHNEIINCALLLNSIFDNINIIINQFIIHYSDKKKEDFSFNNKDSFSFYKLFLIIMKKNIYDKLSSILTEKFKILITKFYKDLFENFNIKYNKNENACEDYDCDNISTNIEDNSDCDNNEEMKEDFTEEEPSDKEVIESYINCEVDYSINEKNSNGINHTELKITKEYENIENIIIEQFCNILKYYMNKDMAISYLFEIIEKFTKCETNHCNIIRNSASLILIRRTKKRLMEKSLKLLLNESLKDLENSFLSHIRTNNNNENYISLTNIEAVNNNDYQCNLKDLSSKKRMKVAESVMNEINNLKFRLKEENIKPFDEEFKIREIENLINHFFNYDGIQEVLLVKKMIWFYYKELGIYEQKNEKIEKILNNRRDYPLSSSFEEKKVLLN